MLIRNRHWKPLRYRWVGMALLYLTCCAVFAQEIDGSGAPPARGTTPPRDVLDLSRAWRLALAHDPVYRAAISEQAASKTERAQGRAGLLPQIHAGYYRGKVTGSATQPSPLGRQIGSSLDYDSYNAYVQLQQPLVDYASYADYRRGNARADMGTAVYMVKRQETGIRLAAAYFNALLAYDELALQRSLTSSLQDQTADVEARYRQHEATRIDAQETRARLALARADVIDAHDQWVVAQRELEALLGAAPTHMVLLRDDFPLPPPMPPDLDEWLANARINNAKVRSARLAVNVASTDVDVAASRYMPTTDLVATYGKAKSEKLSSLSQRTNTFSIGIQISIPLFAGGYNRANVSRARSDLRRVQHEFNATLEATWAEVTRQYTNVQAGADHIVALQAAVASGELSLESARKGFLLGVTSNLEALKAQDRLYQTRYELSKARLEYLLAHLKLAAAAGELNSDTFDHINDTYLGPVVALTRPELGGSVLVASVDK
ncbi:TolC family outer membrane protein [Alcaligenaceae bacterium]|nr:TolC family outer membrane protein [Alcaligenaceae bacterium]